MMEQEALIREKKLKKKKKTSAGQVASFVIIGGLTLVYCIVELAAALYLHSLVLLSDGFHNLSDVVSLYIAFWAQRAAQRDSSDAMSYGWARTEILGGLTNGCFLLSLCMYVALEAIPRIIEPEVVEEGLIFMIVAAAGLFLNIVGTITFAFVGISHGHSHSHGHGHGGHGHAHSHSSSSSSEGDSHSKKKKKAIKSPKSNGKERERYSTTTGDVSLEGDADASALAQAYLLASNQDRQHKDEHSHGHGGHSSHVEGDDHSHGHDDHGDHSHGHDDDHSHGHDDDHSHGHHKEKKTEEKMKRKKEKKEGHDHGHEHGGHGHSHGKKDKKKKGIFSGMSANMFGVFIHFLGDAISSLFVLATGLIVYFYPTASWTKYIDPGVSLFICLLIIFTTVPLVKRCSLILLQGTPDEVNLDSIRHKIQKLTGIISVHDLHVWQLVDGMSIASVHLLLAPMTDVGEIVYLVKEVFHKFGIHSSAVQPEFVQDNSKAGVFCEQNCVEECEEDWCCKKGADNHEENVPTYKSINDV